MQKTLSLIPLILLLLTAKVIEAQVKPVDHNSPLKLVSLSEIKPDDVFVSTEGQFSIRLPKGSLVDFSPLEPPSVGGTYEWELKEGRLALQFFYKPDAASFTETQRQQMLADGLSGGLMKTRGKRVEEEPFNMGPVIGRKIKIDLGNDQILLGRAFSDRTRLYMLVAEIQASVPKAEQLIVQTLDSFRLVEPSSTK